MIAIEAFYPLAAGAMISLALSARSYLIPSLDGNLWYQRYWIFGLSILFEVNAQLRSGHI